LINFGILKDRICLTSSGIDVHALKAGQEIEFSVEADEKNYDIGKNQIDLYFIFIDNLHIIIF
jgi:hypothetical protein